MSEAPAPSATPATTVTPAALGAEIDVRGNIPAADLIDLAVRYGRTTSRAPASRPATPEPSLGADRDFNVLLLSDATFAGAAPPRTALVHATLLAKSTHAYFYADDAIAASGAAMQAAADAFEAMVWPTVTGVFGEPPSPGVDSDPRIVVLQADLGGALGGYYNSDDGYVREVRPLSNEAEMVYMDSTLRPGGAAFTVVLAHELQHLIHTRSDDGEESWVNEGLSDNASKLAGGANTFVQAFASEPQTQLNAWDREASAAHYGAGSAFVRYLASRFGGDAALGTIARQPGDGAQGIDEFLSAAGSPLTFGVAFADWMAANVLNAGSGPYSNGAHPVTADISETLAAGSEVRSEASQFGSDYYDLPLETGSFLLRFGGVGGVDVLPIEAPSAGGYLWSNTGDSIDGRMTREVNLDLPHPVELTFRTWYDIEGWLDWGYVSVSTDDGATWQALAGNHTSTDDPARTAYGPGYSGTSRGGSWVDERVSLAAYAGKTVELRFEYVTDGGVHLQGWAIDDVALEGDGSRTPLDAAGWQREGWVVVDRGLPQTYAVRLIVERASGPAQVLDVQLDSDQHGELRFSATSGDIVTLAVAGTTEGTEQPAPYTVSLEAVP